MPGLLEEPSDAQAVRESRPKTSSKLPPGVVLDKDGKPCRTCTSSAAWVSMMKSSTKNSSSSSFSKAATGMAATLPAAALSSSPTISQPDCPPDVEELGRSTWTMLHSMTAQWPATAPPEKQSSMRQFLNLFSQFYPCWVCADDFRSWIAEPENEPQLKTQEDFGQWMCRAHNAVNVKLGKPEFDCNLWRQRWKDGWKDGRCD